jgi:cation diffusion facilitator CzcD-associated flavoprotein CzcO
VTAGWFGLAQAKTRRQLHPESSLVVFEAAPTIGGVWAAHRLYPALKTNNLLGTYEYPDFPMDTKTYGVKQGEHIPGIVIHRYLADYAEKFGVADKIRFKHHVVSAEHQESGGWVLSVESEGRESTIFARKLVVATGLTSEPWLPDFEGQKSFGAPVFHTKDFPQHADTLSYAVSVTVFGGAKSAWDMVYAYGTKGIKVNWVIRSEY